MPSLSNKAKSGRDENNRGKHLRTNISRLRIGHAGINKTMHLIWKHPSGQCECGSGEETGACHLSLLEI